ncbi:extracellular solute-binding protein [Alkalilimnicola ehrlichii]|uniref:ABC transporter substrate-binding protein n=1 Tax=Alkalilimnicola ehrlichii TaxID=351052 RepID=A0A3E0WLP9_9GAMM|nr:extracellular solute-binding protein [Alkalilimnicola ehrlichii]RFA33882.1 ABC transporter substrate-binding protein [Alkalilimnicola ehrlichii]
MFSVSTQRERALNVYAAGPGSLMKRLIADFCSATHIDVNLFQATTGKVLARLEAEADNPRADVFISASWDLAIELDKRDWLLPYESPAAATVPAAFKTPTYIAQAFSALGIAWNRRSGTPEPQDWADLAQPAFRHRITTPDPSLSGASLDLLLGLQDAMGDAAWNLLTQLRDNGMTLAAANDQALSPVLRGRKAAVFGCVDYIAYNHSEKGAPLKVIFPHSGTVIAPRPMMILKSSRSPEQARKLIDYLLSEAGQRSAADAWLMPARQDIAAKRPPFQALRLLPLSNAVDAHRRAALARFAGLFDGEPGAAPGSTATSPPAISCG